VERCLACEADSGWHRGVRRETLKDLSLVLQLPDARPRYLFQIALSAESGEETSCRIEITARLLTRLVGLASEAALQGWPPLSR
jgi:hypothetical protein